VANKRNTPGISYFLFAISPQSEKPSRTSATPATIRPALPSFTQSDAAFILESSADLITSTAANPDSYKRHRNRFFLRISEPMETFQSAKNTRYTTYIIITIKMIDV
jgi:hypothetical protein